MLRTDRNPARPIMGAAMRGPLTIAVAQPECEPFDVAANAEHHAELVRRAHAQMVIFPQLSLTGYELGAPPITHRDQRLAPVVEACAEVGALALVGAPVHGETGRSHIGMLAVSSGGVTVAHHKMWLEGEEPHRFAQGNTPSVLSVDGWRVGLAVGRDLWEPQHVADTALGGLDLYAAATVTHPHEAIRQEERAHEIAIGYQVWVAVASFAGITDGYSQAAGRSTIWSPTGDIVAQVDAEVGAVARATLQ